MSLMLSWSGGKDSMLAFHYLQEQGKTPERLFTTFSGKYNRITMHGVREELLDEQTRSLDTPAEKLFLSEQADMKSYNAAMHDFYAGAHATGTDTIAFGDINLEDLRNYRERLAERAGLKCIFPIWGRDTRELMEEFIDLGYRTVVVAVDGSRLPQEFCGRFIDHTFLEDLPEEVDPCGENGEFHTFVTEGPLLSHPVKFTAGEVVSRHYPSPVKKNELITYYFQELLPV